VFQHQVLVVGGGLAGMRAAIEASATAEVALLAKVYLIRSHSGAARGGINAALGNHPEGREDSPQRHAFDTVKSGDYLADQPAALILAREAPERIIESEHWGAAFSRFADGRIAQRRFGGSGFPRTCHAAEHTGHALLHTLYQQTIKRKIKIYPEWQMLALAVEEGRCHGVIALDRMSGETAAFAAEATILATGGAGRLYAHTTNGIINTGSGMAVAYWAGAALKDMEFMQFHPTTLFGTNILANEGGSGEGGYLLNVLGERYMQNYAPKLMELAPRDVVARATQTEIDAGRGFEGGYVLLDLRYLGEKQIRERLPGISELCLDFLGINPAKEPVPIQPGQNYTMGGIACNEHGETEIAGLYAAGECACVSVHGANRLGGNSQLETLVFGKRAGESAAKKVQEEAVAPVEKVLAATLAQQRERVEALLKRAPGHETGGIRAELRTLMTEKVGIFKHRAGLTEALEKIKELQERFTRAGISHTGRTFNLDLARALELEGKLALAEVIAAGARARAESRGGHCRVEYPRRDDQNWLKHTVAHCGAEGPALSYGEVAITDFPVEERGP